MRSPFAAVFALATLVAANPVPGGVSSAISPQSSAPPGCSPNYKGSFQIAPVNVSSSSKRSLERRQDHNALTISLSGGILTDSQGRTGYVASNYQFQFDDPPQAGAIYTAGFSVCPNGRLAIGGATEWQKCLSGPGTTNGGFFYNLYLKNDGGQCIPSYILAEPYGSGSGPIPVSGGSTATTTGSTTSSSSTASSASSSPAGNSSSTMVVTSSSASMNATMSSSSSTPTKTTSKHTGGGVTQQTTITTSQAGPTTGGGQPTQTTGSGGTGTQTAASSSTAAGAAATHVLRTDVLGLAAGLLAYAVL